MVDKAWQTGDMESVQEWCKQVRQLGVLVGVGTHKPEIIEYVEEKGWDVDFYAGCVYNRRRTPQELRKLLGGELPEMANEVYLQDDPPRMYRVFQQTKKPCIAFKIMAAGRVGNFIGTPNPAFHLYQNQDQNQNSHEIQLSGRPNDKLRYIVGGYFFHEYNTQRTENVILAALGQRPHLGAALSAALNGEDTRIICLAGDGGTFDIGFATLSAAAERNEDILFVCYDNEIYGNTGGQRSSATPQGAVTSNTLEGKLEQKKDILAVMAAHRIPYAATACISHPQDYMRKVARGLEIDGPAFINILQPCHRGWGCKPEDSIELARQRRQRQRWQRQAGRHCGARRAPLRQNLL